MNTRSSYAALEAALSRPTDTDEAELNRLQSALNHIFFTLVFVFMVVALVTLEQQEYWRESSEGQAVVQLDQALIDLQYQALLMQLHQKVENERQRLSLDLFVAPSGAELSYRVAEIVADGVPAGPLADEFSRGCRRAARILSTDRIRWELKSQWVTQVIQQAGMFVPNNLTFIGREPNAVVEDNLRELRKEVSARIAGFYEQTLALHNAIREEMYAYYFTHPNEIDDDQLTIIIKEYDGLRQLETASDNPDVEDQRRRLVAAIHSQLEKIVADRYIAHGVPLLK